MSYHNEQQYDSRYSLKEPWYGSSRFRGYLLITHSWQLSALTRLMKYTEKDYVTHTYEQRYADPRYPVEQRFVIFRALREVDEHNSEPVKGVKQNQPE